MSQNFYLRFLVQSPNWLNKIYLFDSGMKILGSISIRWDDSETVAISSTFDRDRNSGYRKSMKANSEGKEMNELQDIVINYDGRKNLLLWGLWGQTKPKLFTIPFEKDPASDQLYLSFGKTLRRHNVRFSQPSKLRRWILRDKHHSSDLICCDRCSTNRHMHMREVRLS